MGENHITVSRKNLNDIKFPGNNLYLRGWDAPFEPRYQENIETVLC